VGVGVGVGVGVASAATGVKVGAGVANEAGVPRSRAGCTGVIGATPMNCSPKLSSRLSVLTTEITAGRSGLPITRVMAAYATRFERVSTPIPMMSAGVSQPLKLWIVDPLTTFVVGENRYLRRRLASSGSRLKMWWTS
jgi:hypothetical protein